MSGFGYMYLWDETTAKRGAIEIASCLYKFICTQVPPTIKKLYIFSDNCAGQNKNYIMQLFYLCVFHTREIEIIHVFFRVGHSYMPADSHFATIENAIQRHGQVYTPTCYEKIIKKCRETGSKLIESKMTQNDFLDFEALKEFTNKNLRKHPKEENFSTSSYFRVSKDYQYGYEYGHNYLNISDLEHPSLGNLMRVAKGPNNENNKNPLSNDNLNFKRGFKNIRLPKKYTKPIPLDRKKADDLKSYVPQLVPEEHLNYWNQVLNLVSTSEDDNDDSDADDMFFDEIFTEYE